MEEDARAEMEKALYDLVDAVATQTKTSRTKVIENLVKDVEYRTVETQKIDGYEPEFENVTTTEDAPDYHEETRKVPISALARFGLGAAEFATHLVTSPVNLVQGIANVFGAQIADKDFIGNIIHESFEKDSYRNETVIVSSKKQVTRTEQRLKGMKAQKRMVTERVPYVVEKMQKVGEKFVQGGYPVVENLLAIGLAIESASANPSVNISENFDQIIVSGQQKVKALLGRYEEQINQLAESSDPDSAEAKIIKILESVLLS
jgi:hypothetical protein